MSDMSERRKHERKRSLKRGMIVFNDRYCSTECVIRNESDFGALLKVEQNQAIPSHIEIRQYPNPAYRPAQIIWRSPDAVGIRYTDVVERAHHGSTTWDGVERRGNPDRRTMERRRS